MDVYTNWPAPAKLNLFLRIVGRRPDGYHLLQTAFQFIDICDWISFDLRKDGVLRRCNPLPGVNEENDLTIRAARLLQNYSQTPLGTDVRVEKNIPIGGGLGGGSSDAATALVALNYLWDLGLTKTVLAELGLKLGADVPVFVHGYAAWAEGVGEQLSPIKLSEPWYVVIAPRCHVPTGEIFSALELTREAPPITIRGFLAGHSENVFEPVVRKRFPQVAEALDWLSQYAKAKLTGTGACVYAAFESEGQASEIAAKVPREWKGFKARGMNDSPLYKKLSSHQEP